MSWDYDKAHVGDLLGGKRTWFTAQLLRLIAKADRDNRSKLRKVFPEQVQAVEEYLGLLPTGAA